MSMKRKSAKEASLDPDFEAPEFEADDEFVVRGNQDDEWRQAAIEENAPVGDTLARPTAAASPPTAPAGDAVLVDPEVGEMASDAFKALAAQIISTFGADATSASAPSAANTPEVASPVSLAETPAPEASAPLADPFAGLPPIGSKSPADSPVDAFATPEVPSTPDEDIVMEPKLAPTPAAAAAPEMATVIGESVAPRITIHAFCHHEAQMELVKEAARDRRMERASTVVRPGGLAAAVEYYQNQPTPSLIIVEAGESASELLSLLGRLAETCDPGRRLSS